MRSKFTALLVVAAGAVLSYASPRTGAAVQKLYWTDDGRITRSNLDGSDVETVIDTRVPDVVGSGENYAYLTADPTKNKLYYAIGSPTPQLWSADFDGSNRQLLATLDTDHYVRGMAFEQDAKQLYWTSFHGYQAGNGKIRSANADGSGVRDVLSLSDGYPYGMAVDHAKNVMFWANTEQNTLERANLDGSGRQVIGSGVSLTTQLAVDTASKKLYWTDVDHLKIHWSNYDGSESAVIASPGSAFSAYDGGIAVDHSSGSLFWSDTSNNRIFRANLDGSNPTAIVTSGLDNPGAMVVVNNPEPSLGCIFLGVLATGAALSRRRGR